MGMVRSVMDILCAMASVWLGRAERICAPGQWVVWRDETGVRVEVKASSELASKGA